MEDTWINPLLKVNSVVFNKDTKEFLLITNGICVLNHKDPEGYAKDHSGCGCRFRPHEAVALRVISHHEAQAVTGWTYITIPEGADLEPAPRNHDWFMRAFKARVSRYNVGRL